MESPDLLPGISPAADSWSSWLDFSWLFGTTPNEPVPEPQIIGPWYDPFEGGYVYEGNGDDVSFPSSYEPGVDVTQEMMAGITVPLIVAGVVLLALATRRA